MVLTSKTEQLLPVILLGVEISMRELRLVRGVFMLGGEAGTDEMFESTAVVGHSRCSC